MEEVMNKETKEVMNEVMKAIINIEMECGLSDVNPETLKLLDELELIEFNKMGCPYWYEVDECINNYQVGKKYFAFAKLIN